MTSSWSLSLNRLLPSSPSHTYIFVIDCQQVKLVLAKHEDTDAQDYSNDNLYRRMVSESLQVVTMAASAMQVLLHLLFPYDFPSRLCSSGSKTAPSASMKFRATPC